MHFVSLELKRAHWQAVRVATPVAETFGLTPARFDLLFAIRTGRAHCNAQIDIARFLGFSGATISRMLTSLEKLGWIRRVRSGPDRRAKRIELTSDGRTRIDEAIASVIGGRTIHRVYQAAYDRARESVAAALRAVDSLAARSIYRRERSRERERVSSCIESLFNDVEHIACHMRGAPSSFVYRPPWPHD